MDSNQKIFGQFVWQISKSPLRHLRASPLAQSASAVGINGWCLFLIFFGQFWVLFSFCILFAQTYNTWLVSQNRMPAPKALIIGIVIVLINFIALSFSILGQFWVLASLGLAMWQYVSLIRVCLPGNAETNS